MSECHVLKHQIPSLAKRGYDLSEYKPEIRFHRVSAWFFIVKKSSNINADEYLVGTGIFRRPEWQNLRIRRFQIFKHLPDPFPNRRHVMAPIKRLLSTKNTTPSQKGLIFLQEQNSIRRLSCFYLRPKFLKICCADPIHLLTGTHQDQGQRKNT